MVREQRTVNPLLQSHCGEFAHHYYRQSAISAPEIAAAVAPFELGMEAIVPFD
jgi:hypothetical protein